MELKYNVRRIRAAELIIKKKQLKKKTVWRNIIILLHGIVEIRKNDK